jgi:hypothetical protein
LTAQFENPGTTTALDFDKLNGKLLLIKPQRVEVGVKTALGDKDATVADVHVVDGPGEALPEAFIWPRVLQVQLRSFVGTGKFVLGRLGQGTAKPGQNPPWKLADPTDADKSSATQYLDRLNGSPIAAPDDTAGDDDPPPWEKK